MDRELEILWGEGFSVVGIFIISNYHKSGSPGNFLRHTLDSAVRTLSASFFNKTSEAALTHRPTGDIDPTHTLIHINNGA